jgi:hypothetical protein
VSNKSNSETVLNIYKKNFKNYKLNIIILKKKIIVKFLSDV